MRTAFPLVAATMYKAQFQWDDGSGVGVTTSQSPVSKLKKQSDQSARILKAAERGEQIAAYDPAGKIAAARKTDRVKFAIAMDDKVIVH